MNNLDRYMYRLLVTVTVILVAGGTIFYHLVEKWSILDAYYFCVVSLATVGYGDFTPQTSLGRLFTTFYIMAGIGILGAFINAFVKKRGNKIRTRADEKQKQ